MGRGKSQISNARGVVGGKGGVEREELKENHASGTAEPKSRVRKQEKKKNNSRARQSNSNLESRTKKKREGQGEGNEKTHAS